MSTIPNSPGRGEETRAALVAAALQLTGDKGFGATSTREIAAAAGVNVAMIAYHFGGKDGLRLACADFVGERMREIFGAVGEAGAATRAQARAMLKDLARALIRGVVADEAARPLARFLLREMSDASPAFSRLFETALQPLHARACRLWARATGGEPESVEARLSVFAMLAQIVYFRIARAPVLMRMGWSEIGPGEAAAIETVVLAHLQAALEAAGRRAT
jgi:TetR/AcrR family transcriptional regulator, regulator of cefoperazone and chloramphenicol sensitivity